MPSLSALTDEQRAVVAHGAGPAVVRAVPGAGKTTALLHRIRALVEDRGVAPDRILASSFSRATVRDLERGLSGLGVEGVDTRTLHALGLSLLRHSGRVPTAFAEEEAPDPATAASVLARHALIGLADERDLDAADLGVSAPDLADQVAAWKQQLAYPDVDAAGLPPSAREHVTTATHENEDLERLYRRFETLRRQRAWLTYPDMLRGAWEALVQEPSLREAVQEKYRFVLVDEFQDVSQVQVCLLDVVTRRHDNYVVIGDADQCIYGWRGASPSSLLDEAARCAVDEYVLTESFRLPAGPLVLADALSQHNEARRPKPLHLTQGFEGTTRLLSAEGPSAVADRIAATIDRLQERGISLPDIAVLVRTYGQTPPLERAFIEHTLPYRIRGASPFYERREVQTLLRYLYWAVLERRRRRRGGFDHPKTARRYADRFAHILKTPTRYVEHGRIDRVVQEARRQERSALDVLADHVPALPDQTADRVDAFLETATSLVERLDAPPHDTLRALVDAIDYEDWLRARSAFTERGDARIRTVQALVQYAANADSTPALLENIRSLAAEQAALDDSTATIDLRSIHRAKGAEWPVVIVPGLNEDTLPLEVDPDERRDLEEERRLCYVAVTRARENLYLATDAAEQRSRFLDEAEVASRLPKVEAVRTALDPGSSPSTDDVLQLCHAIGALDRDRYLRRWWSPSADRKATLRSGLEDLRGAIERAERRVMAYRQAQAEHEARKQRARTDARERAETLRTELGDAPLTAPHEQPDTSYPEDARFRFEWADDETSVHVCWNGTVVGTLDPFGTRRLDAQTVLDLPWSAMVGRFEGVGQGRSVLRFTIDWAATRATLQQEAVDALSSPEPPSERDRLLTGDAFERGYALLREVLS